MAQILIIDDEVLLARSLSRNLSQRGHECSVAATAEDGLDLIRRARPDVILLDMQLPGMSGLEALKQVAEFDPSIVVIIVTAYGTVATATEAMQLGAADFLRKPLDLGEISLTIDRALSNARMRDTLSYYRSREVELAGGNRVIGNSPAMRSVIEMIEKISRLKVARASDAPPILITGETGTGKDLAARVIHHRSRFADYPFIDVNCPTLPRGLEEAELFGYERGAFTDARRSKRGLFEAANGGTMFLNEIGDLSIDVQVKLLQVIERKTLRHIGGLRDIPIDVRIVAATNKDLESAVREGLFREDLYHRLHHFYIQMPPLRTRGDDILLLATHFLDQSVRKYGLDNCVFTPEAQAALKSYHWPGNLRELYHVVDRAVVLSQDNVITASVLGLTTTEQTPKTASGASTEEFVIRGQTLDEIERAAIALALEKTDGNVSESARMLGVGREALRYRIKKHRLDT